MLLKNEPLENRQVLLTIRVDKEDWQHALQELYNDCSSLYPVEGCAPGKATREQLEAAYGKDFLYQDAVNHTFPEALVEAVAEANLQVAAAPDLSIVDIGPGGYIFTALVQLYPEVKLGQYKGLSAPMDPAELTERDGDEAVARWQQEHLHEEHPERAAMGDEVVLDFEGFVDGVAFDGGKGESYPLELGSGSFIPGFEEQIVGMKAGEEKDIDVTFPEDYQAEELAGQPVVFSIKLHEVKAKDMPELDDEFAKDVSEFDTLEELKADLRKKEEESREASAKQAFENNLMELVAENMECDIPEAMVENQARRVVDDYKMQVQSQGMRFADYLQMTGMKEADLLDSAKEPALRQLRGSLALEAIIKAEGIEATEEEVDAEMQKMADQYGLSLEDVKKYLRSADVEEQIKREKALKRGVDSASVKVAE